MDKQQLAGSFQKLEEARARQRQINDEVKKLKVQIATISLQDALKDDKFDKAALAELISKTLRAW